MFYREVVFLIKPVYITVRLFWQECCSISITCERIVRIGQLAVTVNNNWTDRFFVKQNLFNSPVMSNKFNVMSSMACLNTIHTYGIPVSCIARLTSIKVMHRK